MDESTPNVGRPTKYRAEYCEQGAKLARLGATDREMADFFEVSESTLNLWKLKHPKFSESLKRSKEEVDSLVEQSLYRRAMGYSCPEVKVFNNNGEILTHEVVKHYPPDTTAQIFWLKNRKPQEWRDRVEHTGKDGEDLFNVEVDEMELARRVGFILQSAAHGEDQCH